jgi:hypothetical protein
MRLALNFLIVALVSSFILSCSSTTTSKTTTVKSAAHENVVDRDYQDKDYYESETPEEVFTETTTTKESSDASCGGIISCTFEGVGFVLALPFRLVAGLIDVIF